MNVFKKKAFTGVLKSAFFQKKAIRQKEHAPAEKLLLKKKSSEGVLKLATFKKICPERTVGNDQQNLFFEKEGF